MLLSVTLSERAEVGGQVGEVGDRDQDRRDHDEDEKVTVDRAYLTAVACPRPRDEDADHRGDTLIIDTSSRRISP